MMIEATNKPTQLGDKSGPTRTSATPGPAGLVEPTHRSGQLDKSNQRVREMFRQIAPRYDTMNHLLSLNIDRYWRRRAVQILPWDNPAMADKPVLDVCTGTGDLAIAIDRRRQASDHFDRVIGTDFCRPMLQIANQKKAAVETSTGDKNTNNEGAGDKDANHKAIQFLEADSQVLPMDDDEFAAVTVAFGLRNVADTDRGLAEMTRVCAPGGRVVVLEFSRPRLPVLKQGYEFYFKRVLPRIGQTLASNDKSAYEYLPQSVAAFPDYEQLTARMSAAGLVDCQFQSMTFGVATLYWGDKPKRGTP